MMHDNASIQEKNPGGVLINPAGASKANPTPALGDPWDNRFYYYY